MKNKKNVVDKLEEEVKKAVDMGEVPIGAVIVDYEGNVISSSHNTRQKSLNVLGHAEINAILAAEQKIGDWRLNGYILVVSLEPCDMCSMIIKESRLDKVLYFVESNCNKQLKLDNFEYIYDEIYTEKFNKLLVSFFDNKR